MPLLDRFRSRPAWQNKDADARLAAVRQLTPDQREVLAAVAKEDEDARVRRAAVRRLDDLSVLSELAKADADESVRQEAVEALLGVALSSEDAGAAETALGTLHEARHLVQVARGARLLGVRRTALSRLQDPRSLAAVARTAEDHATRQRALEAIHDAAVLAELAQKCELKDVAVGAASRLTDREALEAVAERARNKAAARQARALLETLAPAVAAPAEAPEDPAERARFEAERYEREAREAAGAKARQERRALLTEVEGLDGHEPPERLAEARAGWEGLAATDDAEASGLSELFARAVAEAERRGQEHAAAQARRGQLAELCQEMESTAEAADLEEARRQAGALRERWAAARAAGQDAELQDRFEHAEAHLREREAQVRAETARQLEENHTRLAALSQRVETLARKESLTRKEAEAGLREARAAIDDPGPLTRIDRAVLLPRLKAARSALFPRVQELREEDEWTRWANVPLQEDLCKQAELLLAEENLDRMAQRLHDLDERWKEVRLAPKDEGEALWRRFKAARDQAFARVQTHFAKRRAEEAENFKRKEALCVQAEALMESTDWLKTAEALQKLQAEWKTVGPAPRKHAQAIWERFRKACDHFFSRRKEDLDRRKDEWSKNLEQKEAFCVQAEALAQSTDWDKAAGEIKRLQAEWKSVGPVRKNKSEIVWQRFRKACDTFFDRYKNRHDLERQAQSAAREALVVELEELAQGEAPEDLVERVQSVLSRWRQAPVASRSAESALGERLAAARNAVVAAHPDRFQGTELDPAANQARREKLCAKVEALLPAEITTAQSLAERLREALATNTIAGRGEAEARQRAAAEEVRAAQAAWKRIGPVPGAAGAALENRFQSACQRFFAQR
jgi:uncharacterized protein DUF349